MKLSKHHPGENLTRALRREWNRLHTDAQKALEARLPAGRARMRMLGKPRGCAVPRPHLEGMTYRYLLERLVDHGVHPARKLTHRIATRDNLQTVFIITNRFKEV